MTTEQPYVEPSHRLSDADWVIVAARAKAIREDIKANAQGGAASGIVPVNDMTAQGIASRKYFAESGIPTQLLVLHSGECPLAGGYARSLTLWAATVYPLSPIASWTWFIDPLEMVAFIPPNLGAWHASEANVLSEGFEQAGYARYTRAEWLTPDGQTQLESLAFYMAQRALANGIPARWLTDAEVTAATTGNRSIKGLCFHRQIDPDTRTDPGNGYPADLLLERIKFYMAGGSIQVQGTTTTTEEDDQDMSTIFRDTSAADPDKTWIGDGITRRHISSPKELAELQEKARQGKLKIFDNGEVQIEPEYLFGTSIQDRINDAVLAVLTGSQEQEDVTRKFLADRIKESTPAEIVALIPDEVAQAVIDRLAERIAK